jgi:hypothetical protein
MPLSAKDIENRQNDKHVLEDFKKANMKWRLSWIGACGSLLVKALDYKPGVRGFETR